MGSRDRVRKPWAMVLPNGPAAARSTSTWIHWWSPVASAKVLIWSWVTVCHGLCPRWLPCAAASAWMSANSRMRAAPPSHSGRHPTTRNRLVGMAWGLQYRPANGDGPDAPRLRGGGGRGPRSLAVEQLFQAALGHFQVLGDVGQGQARLGEALHDLPHFDRGDAGGFVSHVHRPPRLYCELVEILVHLGLQVDVDGALVQRELGADELLGSCGGFDQGGRPGDPHIGDLELPAVLPFAGVHLVQSHRSSFPWMRGCGCHPRGVRAVTPPRKCSSAALGTRAFIKISSSDARQGIGAAFHSLALSSGKATGQWPQPATQPTGENRIA